MLKPLSIFAGTLLCISSVAVAAPRKMENTSIVVMRTIDKLSARTHTSVSYTHLGF